MRAFLKLIRWYNLVIVVLTQVLIRYALMAPVAGLISVQIASTGAIEPMTLQLPLLDFIILVFATVAITAGGYAINDYFDVRTDLINRGEVIVGTKITRRRVIMWHNILNVIGVLAGFYISYRVGYFWIGLIFLVVSGLLYFYSASYKRQLLIGNIIVALLTAMVPLMVLAFELPVLFTHYSQLTTELPSLLSLLYWVGGFAVFAFLTTLAREVIKDMEDFEGDKAYGTNSLPVAAGMTVARTFVLTIQIATMVLLLITWYYFLHDIISLVYTLLAVITPLIVSSLIVIRAKTHKDYYRSSQLMKIAMLGGIFYSIIFWLIIEKGLLA